MTYQSGSTTEKLQLLLNTKEAIAKAIEDRGIRLTNRNKFSTYPSEIRKIQINGLHTLVRLERFRLMAGILTIHIISYPL